MKDISSAKSLTVRNLTEEDKAVIKIIVKETDCKQVSRALLRTAHAYVRLCDVTRKQSEEIALLRKELEMYRQYAEIVRTAGETLKSGKNEMTK